MDSFRGFFLLRAVFQSYPPDMASKKTRKGTALVSEIHCNVDDSWTFKVCKNTFGQPDDKVIDCDRCADHYCMKRLKMNEAVYDYMTNTSAIWCCMICTDEARRIISQKNGDTTQVVTEMKKDLDETMNSVNCMVNDFYCFMNGPTVNENLRSNDTTAWTVPKNPVNPLKEIIMETSEEQKRVMEEEQKRKMNIIIHRAPESNEIESQKRSDNSSVSSFLEQVVANKLY